MSTTDSNEKWNELKLSGMQTNDYSTYINLCKKRTKNLSNLDIRFRKKIKLAILGSASTNFIAEPLEFALNSLGIECEILDTPFNTYAYQILDSGSVLNNFKPDVVIMVNVPFSQPEWPDIRDGKDNIDDMVNRSTEYWINLCSELHNNTGCEIIFDNFFQLPWKPAGNLAPKIGSDFNNYITRLNSSLARSAPSFVHIHDVAWMAANHGVKNWFDLKYWNLAKLPVALKYTIHYIKNCAAIISSLYGGTKKVMVLDLDNTLWGGVIGDDGLDGIKIGQGSPTGEAFSAFQKYIRQLKDRGVLLAVCSKNDESNARLPFEKHPEMSLKLDDFVCFVANWEPKTNNIIKIANTLSLGIDSFVFVDDNPVERELMRTHLPDVVTIELGGEPADYPALIDEQSPFEITSFGVEDISRTSQYQENYQREALKTTITNYEDYLVSLEQQAFIGSIEEHCLDRVTQLINKTNQFNLTTQRKTRSEVEAIMMDERYFFSYVQLADKFGDNGIIAVIFGSLEDESLDIDGWLMSCRVLKRGVEKMICNYLVEQAKINNKKIIKGTYIPSGKNNMVESLYPDLGFRMLEKLDNGSTKWELDVRSYNKLEHPIAIKEINDE